MRLQNYSKKILYLWCNRQNKYFNCTKMIYKYRASIPGSKVFMREYEIKGETTLYRLHDFLVNDFDFSPDQMVAFRGMDEGERIRSEYGLFDMGDGSMDMITVEKTIKKGEVNLLYVFDLRNDRFIKLTLIGEAEESRRASYPRLVAEKGRNPEQFAKGYDDMDQYSEPMDDSSDESSFMDDELPEGEEL